MSQETYHIPNTPTAFFHFQNETLGLCTANAAAWNIPPDTMTSLTTLQAAYISAYNIASNHATQSPAATAARDAAQDALNAALADLYNNYLLNNSTIDADDKAALHLHQTGGRSGKPAPPTGYHAGGSVHQRRAVATVCSVCRFCYARQAS